MWCVTYSDPDETDRMVIMPDYPKVGRNYIIDEYEIKQRPYYYSLTLNNKV